MGVRCTIWGNTLLKIHRSWFDEKSTINLNHDRTEHSTTTVKNPNWPEASQLAIYKCSWEVEPGTTRINEWSERVLNPGSPDLKASALTTGPHWLLCRVPLQQEYPPKLLHVYLFILFVKCNMCKWLLFVSLSFVLRTGGTIGWAPGCHAGGREFDSSWTNTQGL